MYFAVRLYQLIEVARLVSAYCNHHVRSDGPGVYDAVVKTRNPAVEIFDDSPKRRAARVYGRSATGEAEWNAIKLYADRHAKEPNENSYSTHQELVTRLWQRAVATLRAKLAFGDAERVRL